MTGRIILVIRDLVKKLGTRKAAIAIAAVSVVTSAVLYLILSEIIDDFSSKGFLRSMLIPGVIAPILSYLFLRIYVQLDLAEEELRKEKTFIESALDNLLDAFVVLDPHGRFLRWNKVVTEATGHSNEKMPSLQPADFLTRETLPGVSEAIERVLRDGHARAEAVVMTKDGRKIPYEFTAGLLRQKDGHPWRICVSGRNITERKQVENTLREEEERYRSVFENTGTATVIIEQDRIISMANTEFERLSGFTKEEIEGKMKWTKFVVKEDLERMREYHGNRREGLGAPPTEYEFQFIGREGIVKEILNKVSMIPGTRKSVASLLDISERKRMEEEKRELESRLRQAQKMEALGTLAGGIAHDFNNILAAIMGHTELASLQVPQESQVKRSLEGVLKAGQRAKDLIKQILSFSRQGEQELKPVLVGPIIDEALNLLRGTFLPAIDIQCHIDHAAMVKADPSQLHQVMMNLFTNAVHAMGENVGVLEVSLTEADMDVDIAASHAELNPGPYVKITVRDTGSGMAPETLERIFEPYFTTKEKGKGTGLGLAVVHGIVKNHGGSVAVESEPGKGTTFQVFLPK